MARIPWLQIDTDLPDHPKVRRLADILGIERDYALGRILRFWCEVARYYPSGDFSSVPDSELARCFRWRYGSKEGQRRTSSGSKEGEESLKSPSLQGEESHLKGGKKDFFRNLSPIQVLEECGLFNGKTREVHDWKHIYRHILGARKRKEDWKARNVPVLAPGTFPKERSSRAREREEKSREENPLTPLGGMAPSAPRTRSRSPKIPPVAVVVPDDLARFAPQFAVWFRYKHERGEDYRATGLEQVWDRARDLGDQLPQALQEAMASNYAGFFAPKGKPRASPPGESEDERRWRAINEQTAKQFESWGPPRAPMALGEILKKRGPEPREEDACS